MIVGRFVTFFRPLHGLILGTFNIKLRRFLAYDIILSFFWVTIWLAVLLYGEKLWLHFFG
jgi:membrane protein DedA with SNARE-associated domain